MQIDKKLCEQYLEETFDDVKWSFSRINSFNCPYSWYETYLLKKRKSNFHAEVGTAYHEIMEDFYTFKIAGGDIPLDEIKLTLHKKLSSKLLKNPCRNEVFPNMRKSIESKLLASLAHFEVFEDVTAVERYIEFEVAGVKFCGYIDLDAGEYTYDWKSRWSHKYEHQQNLYLYGKEQIDGIVTKGYRIPQYKEGLEIARFPRKQHNIDNAIKWVGHGVERVRLALEAADFPKNPNDSGFCKILCNVSPKDCEFKN